MNKYNYNNLTPFKWFVLEQFPFIEADFDAITNYQLYCKIVEYLNSCIANVNDIGNQMENVTNAFIVLKDYVDNYFENLDVQDEINNKLDEMTLNGTLTDIIKNYVDPIYGSFETEINNKVDGMSSIINSLASGSPLVASSTDSMTDTSRVYVNTTNGKWYYYDGDSWEIGGTYQSTGIGLNTIHGDNLDLQLQNTIDITIPTFTFTDNYYRNSNGVASTNNNYKMSDNIELKQGEIFYICCNGGNSSSVSIISNVTEDGDPIVINSSGLNVACVVNTLNVYKYVAPFDCYISITLTKENGYVYSFIDKSKVKNDVRDKILGFRIPEYEIIPNVYRNGSSEYEHNLYGIVKAIALNEGETIRFHARAEGSVITLLSLVESDGTYISTLVQSNGTREYDVEYTATTDCYVSICSSLLYFKNVYIIEIEDTPNPYISEIFTSFIKMGVIGDSLASGEAVANNGGTNQYIDNYDYSWGQFIARNHGMTCINFSKGGATTRSWLRTDNDWGLSKLLNNENKCNVYVIGLGINDSGLTDYLGSISDINLADFTQNADTFYGNYAKIIGYIKQVQPKAKIFMLTIPADYGAWNTAIRNIASLYQNDVYLIDLNQNYYDEFMSSGFIQRNKREGHYNAIGYNYIGELLFKAFNDYMINNSADFNQIEFINTNYEWQD